MKASKSRRQNKPQPYPAGTFVGTLEVQAEPDWYNEDKNCNLVLYMRENKLLEGDVDCGARPKRQTITVIFDGEHLSDVEDVDNAENFILARSGALLSSLAEAVGAVSEDEDGTTDIDVDGFLEELQNGVYDTKTTGDKLVFGVANIKAGKKAKDPTRIYDDIQWFLAEDQYEGEGYEEEDETADEEEPEEETDEGTDEETDEEEVEEEVEEDDDEDEDEEEEEEEKPAPKKRATRKKSTPRETKKAATTAKSRAKSAAKKARGRKGKK